MLKIDIEKHLPIVISSFIGAGIGAAIAIWFGLPSHTIDVFTFVESAMGIGLTVVALIVTLGVIQQRAAMETMLATKKDEMVAEAATKLETNVFQPFRAHILNQTMSTENKVNSLENAWNVHWNNPRNTKQ